MPWWIPSPMPSNLHSTVAKPPEVSAATCCRARFVAFFGTSTLSASLLAVSIASELRGVAVGGHQRRHCHHAGRRAPRPHCRRPRRRHCFRCRLLRHCRPPCLHALGTEVVALWLHAMAPPPSPTLGPLRGRPALPTTSTSFSLFLPHRRDALPTPTRRPIGYAGAPSCRGRH